MAGIGYFLVGIPLQVHDNLLHLISVQQNSLADDLAAGVGGGFIRPAFWLTVDGIFELAAGHHLLVFKGVHLLLLAALFWLFVGLARVRGGRDLLLLPLATAVLIGQHTFRGLVDEAYPINHYLVAVVCCLLAVRLAMSAGGRWVDALAVSAFVYALLTVELGALVWVCLVAGYLVGMRGVSRSAIVVASLLLILYLGLRFGPLAVPQPKFQDRSSGFGFATLEPDELQRRFGDAPLPFYAYNVTASMLTAVFAEPRNGVFVLTRDLVQIKRPPRGAGALLGASAVLAATLTTLLLARTVFIRRRRWRNRQFDDDDRLLVLFLIMLPATAAIGYPYCKDVLMAPVAPFYALAVLVSLRDWVRRPPRHPAPSWRRSFMLALALVASSAWTVQAADLHFHLRMQAYRTQSEWFDVFEWLRDQDSMPDDPAAVQLVERLRREALAMPVPNANLIRQQRRESIDVLRRWFGW